MSFIDDHDSSIGLVLRVLAIPASTYYDWRAQAESPSRRHREDAEVRKRINKIRQRTSSCDIPVPAAVAAAAQPRGRPPPQTRRADHAGLRPDPFPDQGASLLPGLLAATRTGPTPASDDELQTKTRPLDDHLSITGRTGCRVSPGTKSITKYGLDPESSAWVASRSTPSTVYGSGRGAG
jgi:hypothetical protein